MADPLNFLRDNGDTAFEAPVRERFREKHAMVARRTETKDRRLQRLRTTFTTNFSHQVKAIDWTASVHAS